MSWSLRIARVRGIDIRVHASFALILALVAGDWGARHGFVGAVFGAVLLILLFTCVALHELGHSLVAQGFGVGIHALKGRLPDKAALALGSALLLWPLIQNAPLFAHLLSRPAVPKARAAEFYQVHQLPDEDLLRPIQGASLW